MKNNSNEVKPGMILKTTNGKLHIIISIDKERNNIVWSFLDKISVNNGSYSATKQLFEKGYYDILLQ